MRLKKIYLLIGGIVGVLILASIGFFAYQFFAFQNIPSLPGFSSEETRADVPLQDVPLPEVQQVIMDVPPPDASASAFDQYRANVEFNAKASSVVTITDCMPNPMVLKVIEGSKFKLENRDIKEHTIIVNTEHRYVLNPKETIEVTADFGSGLGIYSYSCDDPAIPAGVFLVRETL